MTSASRDEERYRRCAGLGRLFLLLLAVLGGYVYYVQVRDSAHLAESVERQQSRLGYIPARRGAILDRNDTILNYSIPQYDLAIRIDLIRDPRDTWTVTQNKTMEAIAELAVFLGPDYYLNRPPQEVIARHIRQDAPLPFVLWTNLDVVTKARFAANRHRFPAAELVLTWCRQYGYENTAAHVRGYVRRAPRKSEIQKKLLNFQDVTGASGMEAGCNDELSGKSGLQKIQTDVLSFRHTTVETEAAVPGSNVRLTLDIKLQQLAEKLLAESGCPGAMVLMDASTGELLVLASSPSCHLPPVSEDAKVPGAYTNRATAGYYPPGSTIKPLIALEALSQKVITPEETIYCPGYYELPDKRKVKCSSRNGHGYVNVTEALAMSCNTFFCEVGVRMGEKGFRKLGENTALGELFGKRIGVHVGLQENAGVFFTPQWTSGSRPQMPVWTAGDSANAAIGQGAWIVTPLQMAVYACAITTGCVFQPRIVCGDAPSVKRLLRWTDDAWIPVLQGLVDCVQSPRGTGRRLKLGDMLVWAKTGTAEHIAGHEPHAWMFAVAPAGKPRYVAVAMLEEGGHGGELAAPLIQKLLEEAFGKP